MQNRGSPTPLDKHPPPEKQSTLETSAQGQVRLCLCTTLSLWTENYLIFNAIPCLQFLLQNCKIPAHVFQLKTTSYSRTLINRFNNQSALHLTTNVWNHRTEKSDSLTDTVGRNHSLYCLWLLTAAFHFWQMQLALKTATRHSPDTPQSTMQTSMFTE